MIAASFTITSDAPSEASLEGEVERRLVATAALVRLVTSAFPSLPILLWERLDRPWLAVLVSILGLVEAGLFVLAVRRTGRLRSAVVLADVVSSVVLVVLGSRTVLPPDRNIVMIEMIPFALASSAVVGAGTTKLWTGVACVTVLMVAWVASLLPALSFKAGSDLLGFAVWFVVGRVGSTWWRRLATVADRAREHAERAWRELAELQRELAAEQRREQLARHREALHREVHDGLLPVAEYVASGREVTPKVVRWAELTARRARLRLENDTGEGWTSLVEHLADTVTAAEARGLRVETSLATRATPPKEVVEAVAAAVSEALTNVVKHAGVDTALLAALDDGDGGLHVTVRDRGCGFDPSRVVTGGGLSGSFPAARSCGIEVGVESEPGEGTRVAIRWRPSAHGEGRNGDQ